MLRNFRQTFIGDSNFYRRVILLALPMIIQNAVTSFVSFLDNIMVGQIGTEQMSGVAIVNQLLFVFNICIFGGVSGAGIFSTQFFGKGDYNGQKHCFRFKIYTTLLFSVIAILLACFFGTELISLYLNDSGEVGDIGLALRYGKDYMAIMTLSLIPFALCQSYVSTIRETGRTLVPMVGSVCAVAVNLVLDYLLIFGSANLLGENDFLGIPAMGVKGAATATVVARVVELLVVVIWTHVNPDKCRFIVGAYRSPKIPSSICVSILKKGTPLMINEMMWASGMAVIAQCYAVRGLEVVAAQNISSTITNLFNIVYIQLGGCISVIVGQYLGAGKIKEARDADNKMIFFSVGCCTVVAAIMAAVGRFFPAIYNTEPMIKELAASLILVSALVMPLCSFSHCAYFTLRSGGKTIVTFLFDSVFTWVLMIPFAYVLANFTTLPVVTVVFLVQFTEIIKVVIGFFMLRSGVWLQNIVSDNKT